MDINKEHNQERGTFEEGYYLTRYKHSRKLEVISVWHDEGQWWAYRHAYNEIFAIDDFEIINKININNA